MAYVTVSDIQNEFKSITFGSGTAVGSAAVSAMITQEEALLNSKIGTVYSVPISSTSSNAYQVARLLATLSVKARIMDILPVKVGQSDPEQGNPADGLRERVTIILQDIQDKKLLLDDATLLQSDSGVNSYNAINDIEQTFKRGTDQW